METQSEQLEGEARRARVRLAATWEEFRARMTAGEVIDALAEYARQGPPAEFLGNLVREVRETPLPLTLIATGVVWLIAASSLSGRAPSVPQRGKVPDRSQFDKVSPPSR